MLGIKHLHRPCSAPGDPYYDPQGPAALNVDPFNFAIRTLGANINVFTGNGYNQMGEQLAQMANNIARHVSFPPPLLNPIHQLQAQNISP